MSKKIIDIYMLKEVMKDDDGVVRVITHEENHARLNNLLNNY